MKKIPIITLCLVVLVTCLSRAVVAESNVTTDGIRFGDYINHVGEESHKAGVDDVTMTIWKRHDGASLIVVDVPGAHGTLVTFPDSDVIQRAVFMLDASPRLFDLNEIFASFYIISFVQPDNRDDAIRDAFRNIDLTASPILSCLHTSIGDYSFDGISSYDNFYYSVSLGNGTKDKQVASTLHYLVEFMPINEEPKELIKQITFTNGMANITPVP